MDFLKIMNQMNYLSLRRFFVKLAFAIKQLTQKQRPLIDLTHGCTGTGSGTETGAGTESLRSGCVVSDIRLKGRGGGDGLTSLVEANPPGDPKWEADVEVAWRTVTTLPWLPFRSSSSFRRSSLFVFVRCLILNEHFQKFSVPFVTYNPQFLICSSIKVKWRNKWRQHWLSGTILFLGSQLLHLLDLIACCQPEWLAYQLLARSSVLILDIFLDPARCEYGKHCRSSSSASFKSCILFLSLELILIRNTACS